MYNLTVDEAHTFFVGDGQWLVHNCPPASGGNKNILRFYEYSDGSIRYFPSKNTPLKLGYDENLPLYRETIPGVDYNNDLLGKHGLVSLETLNLHALMIDERSAWQIQILEAMKNTNEINFIAVGMDIFNNPGFFDPATYYATHWEMDQVLRRGYVNKLQLWDVDIERKIMKMEPLPRSRWIDEWKSIRGLR